MLSTLGPMRYIPVCAPQLADRYRSVEDLAGSTFLHDATWSDDWDIWLRKIAPGVDIDTGGPGFSLYALAVEEAANGAGVLIGHEALVAGHIAAGKLVRLFDQPVKRVSHLILERTGCGTGVRGNRADHREPLGATPFHYKSLIRN